MGQSTFGRRRFVALAAVGGAAAVGLPLAGLRRAGPADARTAAVTGGAHTTAPAGGAHTTAAAGVDYPALKRALTGRLLRPGDTGYDAAAQPFNAALGTRKPAAIARVATAADVSATIRRVRGRGVPLAARSGGHSYAGFSTPDHGVVVDLAALRNVTVRADGTAVVGAGARLIDVYATLAAHGRALPGGSCATVGIGGSTLGGGIGVVARAYGLTCDHLRAATVVTADGEIRAVDGNRDADLFWALRGGGGGNGGIVTDFTFTTVPAPTVTIFSLHFPAARSARVLQAWSAWVDAAPHHLSALCAVTAAATPTNRVTGTWTGPPAALAAQLADLIAAVGADPTSRVTHTYDYLSAMKYFAGCLNETVAACHPASSPGGTLSREAFRAASRMLKNRLSQATADRIVDLLHRQRGMVLLFDSLGGQVGTVSPTETAFAHRAAQASVQVYSGNAGAGAAVVAVQQALAPLVGSGAYVNYLNPAQQDWATAYYGANLPRLRRVIRHYDPDSVFTFAQSVLRA
jgi:FAD/FMN-containing dehydrogenase